MLFTNILDSLTAPCLVYNTAMYRYTVYGQCMVHALADVAGAARCMVYMDPECTGWLLDVVRNTYTILLCLLMEYTCYVVLVIVHTYSHKCRN